MGFRTTLIFLVVTAYTVYDITCSLRASFGQDCNTYLRCDSSASLTCQNETCTCLKPDTMSFDPIRGMCVALAGEKCRFTVVEDGRSWLEEVNCITDSKCEGGVCKCDSTFQEVTNGTCVPQRRFGETCSTIGDCRTDLTLYCINGECRCNTSMSLYNSQEGECVGLAGKPCLHQKCTPYAKCAQEYNNRKGYHEFQCKCMNGYQMTDEGICLAPYGGSCRLHTSCLEELQCREGKCVCKYPSHQNYKSECYSLVGGPCAPQQNNSSPVEKGMKCVTGTICSNKGAFRHECTCLDGTVENADRGCDLTYDQPCETGPYAPLKCDGLAPLFCIEGKCQCEELQFYDTQTKKCQGLVGSACEMSPTNSVFCTNGAVCKTRRGSKTTGTCECEDNFTETSNRTCIASFLNEAVHNKDKE